MWQGRYMFVSSFCREVCAKLNNVSVNEVKVGMSRTDTIKIFAGLVLLGFAAYMQFITGFVGDKDMELALARMWVDGKKLYVDIFAVSPPLIFWIYALPVVLSHYVSFLKDYQLLVLMGLATAVLSIAISTWLISRHPAFAGNRKKISEFIALTCFVFIFWTSPTYFFDREHILLLLIFPYIIRLLPSLHSLRISISLRMLIGCMAGIGFCMKPHCAILWTGIQIVCFLRQRSGRIFSSIENICIYSVGALYIFSVWRFTPEYIYIIMPMAMVTYSAANERMGGLYYCAVAFLAFAVTFVDFRLRYTSPYRKDILYFVGLLPFFLLYALTNNGWGYTYNPLISFILITTGWVWWEYSYLRKDYIARGLPATQFAQGSFACMTNFTVNAALTLFVFIQLLTFNCNDYTDRCKQDDAVVREISSDSQIHSFGTISGDFGTWSWLSRELGARWETRFNHLWMLSKFIVSDAEFKTKHQWILDYVGNAMAQDLEERKPDIVFVDHNPEFLHTDKHIDLLSYFMAYPRFAKAWQHYRYVHTIGSCDKHKNTATLFPWMWQTQSSETINMPASAASLPITTTEKGKAACGLFDVYRRVSAN